MTQPSIHFSLDEFADRQRRTRQQLVDHQLDGLLLFKIEDMYWLTGYDSDGFCIFHSMFIGCNNELTHVTRTADLSNLYYSSTCKDVRISPDSATISRASVIKDMLQSHGMQGKRIGIQMDTMGLTVELFQQIQSELSGWCDLVVADQFMNQLRLVKSEQELEYHRKAGVILDDALGVALDTAGSGVYEGDIYGAFYNYLFKMGADLPAHIPPLGSGVSAGNARYTTARKRLGNNDQLTLEMGLAYRHYHAGSMCVALTGPDIRQQHLDMHAALVDCLAIVQDKLRPGNTMGEVYDAYFAAITKAGYGDMAQTACGYTMGATWPPTWMEQPMFYNGNEQVIEPNMTFFNMLILNDFDNDIVMSLGEQVIITSSTPDIISHVPRSPIIIS